MWLYDRNQPDENPLRDPPFFRVSQFSHMPHTLPWLSFPHIHQDEYELGFILSGQGELFLPGCSCPLKRGSITLVPPRTPHYFQAQDGTNLEYYTLRICFPGDAPSTEAQFHELGCSMADSCRMDAYETILKTVEEFSVRSDGVIDRGIQILCLALWEMVHQELLQEGRHITLSVPEYVNEILCYLQEHLGEKITLSDLALRFNLSASHLSRLFTRAYGISPINYLIASRMWRARTYILKEHLSPAEIARRLAYRTTYQFTNAFVRFFGCRPEEYREQAERLESRKAGNSPEAERPPDGCSLPPLPDHGTPGSGSSPLSTATVKDLIP